MALPVAGGAARVLAFWLPFGLAVVTVVGVAMVLVRGRRALASPVQPLPRQVLIMVAAVLILWAPPLATDILRACTGRASSSSRAAFCCLPTPAWPSW